MKKHLNGNDIEMTAEEIAERENQIAQDKAEIKAKKEQEQADKEANDTSKASAKAKLIAGEALTEDEANTIVL